MLYADADSSNLVLVAFTFFGPFYPNADAVLAPFTVHLEAGEGSDDPFLQRGNEPAHVWAAADSGLVINPDGLRNQIEGGIIQSASWTLYEQVRFDKGGIKSRDWASYPIMTMPDVPKVTVELINRPNERPLGAGEGSQGPAVAAIANAVAHATGKRLRDLPLDTGRVKAALG